MKIVLCTTPTDKADEIADQLLNNRLASCVNVIEKIKSKYWWEGKIQTDNESLLIIKTDDNSNEKIKLFIKSIHPYDVPEIVFINVDDVNKPYLDWVLSNINN